MSKVNANIKPYRESKKLSQADLAKLMGKSKNVISNWEHSRNSPRTKEVEQLCMIFGITPNDLFGWKEA